MRGEVIDFGPRVLEDNILGDTYRHILKDGVVMHIDDIVLIHIVGNPVLDV
jgi:hypothetical protein